MKPPQTIQVENLMLEPYGSIVCYPKANPAELEIRVKELTQLGVQAVEFSGKGSAFNIPVLGKGYVGIVAVAHMNGQRVALKMRRIDSGRESLEHEAQMLAKANTANVGPKLLAVSKNFLVTHLIEGDLLADWLENHKNKELMRKVLVDILEQCWRLDEIGLDHGELSKAPKHLLVDNADKPFVVDFETASVERKTANVTAVCQFLFAGNSIAAKVISETLGQRDRTKLVNTLKNYKKNRTRHGFESLLSVCFE